MKKSHPLSNLGGSQGTWFSISVPIISKYPLDICQNKDFLVRQYSPSNPPLYQIPINSWSYHFWQMEQEDWKEIWQFVKRFSITSGKWGWIMRLICYFIFALTASSIEILATLKPRYYIFLSIMFFQSFHKSSLKICLEYAHPGTFKRTKFMIWPTAGGSEFVEGMKTKKFWNLYLLHC